MEFEEIRPYHDEELPQVFEELIADPAFQQVACAVMPGVPFEAIAQNLADISAGGFFLLLNRFGFYYLLILLYLCGIMYCTKK